MGPVPTWVRGTQIRPCYSGVETVGCLCDVPGTVYDPTVTRRPTVSVLYVVGVWCGEPGTLPTLVGTGRFLRHDRLTCPSPH